MNFVIIGNAGSNRVDYFQATLATIGLPPARLITYLDVIENREALTFRPDEIVRLESPGRDFEVERALLAIGAEIDDQESNFWRLSGAQLDCLTFDKGRILPSRQWYLGYCAVLDRIEYATSNCRRMNTPVDIKLMFDKCACHQHLKAQGVAVPFSINPIHSYDDLLAQMREHHCHSVFIKPAHSSSASGVIAYRMRGDRHQAMTTIEIVRTDGELWLYNSRQIQTYENQAAIAELIDAICTHRVHVEQWIPKAGYAGQNFDLRVVMIAGNVRHIVPRLSRSPMTNLHLLNTRGDTAEILSQIGAEHWERAVHTCQQTAHTFDSLYSGIDLLFAPGYRQHAVLEVNAFGDLLPGVLDNGQDTYTAEIMAMIEER